MKPLRYVIIICCEEGMILQPRNQPFSFPFYTRTSVKLAKDGEPTKCKILTLYTHVSVFIVVNYVYLYLHNSLIVFLYYEGNCSRAWRIERRKSVAR
jgi:hypothetical protein